MILSDADLRKEVAAGRLVIEPFNPDDVQPSSIDLHCDSMFRVFANNRYPYIDVKKQMEDLTELVVASEEEPFILHPGEFVLGSTLEKVTLPDNLVARLEGKSSLGRLGLLIHSSLPACEPVMIREGGRIAPRPIGEIVSKRIEGSVVAFDPETFEVGFHEITGWYSGPPDRIFEVTTYSGRRVRVTAGHNLFTLDENDRLARVRTQELRPGTPVAIPDRKRTDGTKLGFNGGLLWDRVEGVHPTTVIEPVYDLEVRPGGRKIENFVAGVGGIFVSNTAGFVDAGWTGHLTLELSNVANLPITLYPGMKIGQLCVFRMTSPAERPYSETGKYQGQEGPTPSRFYRDFPAP